jgi:hypothetical protein
MDITDNINETKLKKLVKLYNNATKEKEDEFEFFGQSVLTLYAKYMIEFYGRDFYVFNRKTRLFKKISKQ